VTRLVDDTLVTEHPWLDGILAAGHREYMRG